MNLKRYIIKPDIWFLFCIDRSKFVSAARPYGGYANEEGRPNNPSNHIYLQLIKKYHGPKSTEGTPRTLTELKIYSRLLDWEKRPIPPFPLSLPKTPTSPKLLSCLLQRTILET
ncbi:MAG: hypothetical protein LH628_15025 [Microcoleus sp. CAN_BIN18]|nr:hypothetical protein [Microcoleus sp. CAN_BIN18]